MSEEDRRIVRVLAPILWGPTLVLFIILLGSGWQKWLWVLLAVLTWLGGWLSWYLLKMRRYGSEWLRAWRVLRQWHGACVSSGWQTSTPKWSGVPRILVHYPTARGMKLQLSVPSGLRTDDPSLRRTSRELALRLSVEQVIVEVDGGRLTAEIIWRSANQDIRHSKVGHDE